MVDPPAGERLEQLGWYGHDDQAYIDRLWALSRAPDPDAVLRALIRLAENPETGWDELNAALLTERPLRGRLFAILGSSLALGDHLAVHPQSWKLLRGRAKLPTRDELRAGVHRVRRRSVAEPGSAVPRLRTAYRDQLLLLAALDVAATVEDEPVLRCSPWSAPSYQTSPDADVAPAPGSRGKPGAVTARHRGWRSLRWANAVPAN